MATESTRKEKEKASGDEKLSKKETAFFESKARGNDAVSAGQWAAAIEAYTEVFCTKSCHHLLSVCFNMMKSTSKPDLHLL